MFRRSVRVFGPPILTHMQTSCGFCFISGPISFAPPFSTSAFSAAFSAFSAHLLVVSTPPRAQRERAGPALLSTQLLGRCCGQTVYFEVVVWEV